MWLRVVGSTNCVKYFYKDHRHSVNNLYNVLEIILFNKFSLEKKKIVKRELCENLFFPFSRYLYLFTCSANIHVFVVDALFYLC